MRPDNPQIQVLNNRIAALSAQIATERGRVTRGDEALTQQVAGYERLQLEREFADRQLASATASLEQARSDALRQQVFLLRVAEPNLPQRATYPQGGLQHGDGLPGALRAVRRRLAADRRCAGTRQLRNRRREAGFGFAATMLGTRLPCRPPKGGSGPAERPGLRESGECRGSLA
jgi:hypothetical protein